MSSSSKNKSHPELLHALVVLITIIAVITSGLFAGINLHSLLLISILIASFSAFHLGYSYKNIREAMCKGINSALPAVFIFVLIGVLIAAFIASGTLATLIYYGIEFISPAFFLPGGLLLCSFMSLATGSSWGTVGTIGVVLMGIGSTMGIPEPVIAGMVISGACFGDKMSPMSDTTNLSAMTSKTNLYSHINSMFYTTGPSYLITLIAFTVIGLEYGSTALPSHQLEVLQTTLASHFNTSLITLLPLATMFVLSVARVSAEPAMMFTSIIAVAIAAIIQEQSFPAILNSLYHGCSIHTGENVLDQIFSRGGITSMMWTLSLSLIALALGGILESCRILKVLIEFILGKVRRTAGLVAATIGSCIVGNMAMGEAYMTIILGGQLFGEAYDSKGIDRRVMSRSLEEGATLTSGLIPWTTGGAFFASTLGVSVLDYAPWALLNWLNLVVSIAMAYMGIALFKIKSSSGHPTDPVFNSALKTAV
ncbi:Na+/H+ antiporter NhaC [Endozoicomonas sp. OPT23]|uniref:Na+/H+ antiporter NhaC n=1 Tax=Endozoicomonas sp. OPT23 TaxID=2072845 RepID=UPI00129AB323|nr:Na+/H+ antiporter NhaC [Endozoicomonas sp. OPT23]MRI34433.1 Na+/H+ antiporter NhaC [Endozoicomonas sp. OPT23]